MGTHRSRKRSLQFAIVAATCATGLASPSASGADPQELPAAYTSIAAPGPAQRAATAKLVGTLVALDRPAPAAAPRPRARYRRFKALSYSRALGLGEEDVTVHFECPGKRRSLAMVELKF